MRFNQLTIKRFSRFVSEAGEPPFSCLQHNLKRDYGAGSPFPNIAKTDQTGSQMSNLLHNYDHPATPEYSAWLP